MVQRCKPCSEHGIHKTYITYNFEIISEVWTWRRHQMETFSSHYWHFVWGIHRSPMDSPRKGPWRGALIFFFDLCMNTQLSKQPIRRWFETPSCASWRHCNEFDSNNFEEVEIIAPFRVSRCVYNSGYMSGSCPGKLCGQITIPLSQIYNSFHWCNKNHRISSFVYICCRVDHGLSWAGSWWTDICDLLYLVKLPKIVCFFTNPPCVRQAVFLNERPASFSVEMNQKKIVRQHASNYFK